MKIKVNERTIIKRDKNNFVAIMNPTNGSYMRTGYLKNGKDTGEDVFMAEMPELIDIGVMGW